MEKITNYLNRCLSIFHVRKRAELINPRLLRFINEAHRDGVMGDARYAVAISKARKLERFLYIIGRPNMPLNAFTTDIVLQFRQFVYDEYKFVPQFPSLYPRGTGHRPPTKRLKDTTGVASFIVNAKNALGEPYDVAFLPDNGARYCSELVRDSYRLADGTYLFDEEPMNFKNAEGEMPVYWEQLFALLGMPVPQGVPGTNPQGMCASPLLETVEINL